MTDQPDISPKGVAKMLDGVTPGPWTADETDPADVVVWATPDPKQNVELIANIGHTVQPVQVAFDCDAANARFIAYAREAVPALAARLAEVEAEGSALSSWQCPFVDGKTGLTSDDYGNQFCAMQRRAEAAEAALAATCQREAASTIRWETKLAASAVSIPTGPGGFVGDVWFGHPTKRTLGTHKWSGSEWVELPSELDSVLQLLSEARQKLAASEARVKRLREALEFYADLSSEGPWHLPGEDYGKRARSAIERHLTDYEVKMAQLKKDFPNGT